MKKLVLNRRFIQIFIIAIAYSFAFLFLYAAISKLLDYETFTVQMAQSPLLTSFAGILGWMVPIVEIGIALFLLFTPTRLIGLYGSFFIMVLFTTYIIFILNFSDFIPCSCGGVLEKMTWHQHLIFNITLVVLSAIAILLISKKSLKNTIVLLSALLIIGNGSLALLFGLSENKVHRNNSFIRRYPPATAMFNKAIDLKYNSWYIAGTSNSNIYLGNSTAPLNVKILDTTFKEEQNFKITLDAMDLPFSAVKVTIEPPYFYVADGLVPAIFRGKITDWQGRRILNDSIFFTNSIPLDSTKTAVRFIGGKSGENEIGVISIEDSLQFAYSHKILEKQIDGLFDTDGKLLYNKKHNRLLYVYFYRNEYIIFNSTFKSIHRAKTIDTVSMAQVKVSTNSLGEAKMASPSFPINKYAATYGNYLYVQSDRLGRFEPKEMLKEASIIDVYDLTDQSYQYSFYIYHYKQKKMNSFIVQHNKLWALMDKYLVLYNLEKH